MAVAGLRAAVVMALPPVRRSLSQTTLEALLAALSSTRRTRCARWARPTPPPSTTFCSSILQKEVVTIWEAMALEETLILQHMAAGFFPEVLHENLAVVLSSIPVLTVPSPLKVLRVFGEMPVMLTLAPLQHEIILTIALQHPHDHAER